MEELVWVNTPRESAREIKSDTNVSRTVNSSFFSGETSVKDYHKLFQEHFLMLT